MIYTNIGSVCEGKIGVQLVTPEPGGRGTARVELAVYGARYAYKLSAAEALVLAQTLLEAAGAIGSRT